MAVNYVALSIPIFLILMGMEIFLSLRSPKKVYRFNDSISNLSNGLGQQAVGIFSKMVLFLGYKYIYDHFAYFDFSNPTIIHWLIALLMADISYYFFHRVSHRVNLLVGSHVVHHQSEEYNLSVALRQSWLTRFYSWIFYIPMAIVGVPPLMFLTISAIVIIYQFWVHTQFISTLGVFESIFVTPSHHRVHHGRNPEYVDKNYGGIFIWWDMLFGTFEKEKEKVVYGIINPANTWNPLYANFRYYKTIYSEAKKASHFIDKIKIWFSPPEWRPRNLESYGPIPTISNIKLEKYNVGRNSTINLLIALQFTISLAIMAFVFVNKKELSSLATAGMIGLVIWCLTNIAGIQENKRWALKAQLLFFSTLIIGIYLQFLT